MKIYNPEGKIISGFVFALLVIGVFSWITYRNMCITNADSKEVSTSLHILKSVKLCASFNLVESFFEAAIKL